MIAERLKTLRKAAGISQEEVGKAMNVTQPAIAKWERGDTEPNGEALLKLADYFHVTTDYLLGGELTEQRARTWIPVHDNIKTGLPITIVENVLDYEEITPEMAARGEYIALQVKGSGMEPNICDGDIAILHVQEEIENGEIAAVFVQGDAATLKRVKKEKDGLWLVSINRAYSPLFYTQKEIEELPIRILGKLVEIRRKF